jgi:hypothetical protein
MLHKGFVCILFAATLFVTACSDDSTGGAGGGKWTGEVFANSKSSASTVVGEFDSYTECVEATQKEAKSGVFNCGIKTNR